MTKIDENKRKEYVHDMNSDLYVSFDFHAYLLKNSMDKGELADVIIEDKQNGIVFAIEAKYLTDWNFDKDIITNKKRIDLIKNEYSKKIIQILLITKRKYENTIKAKNIPGSNYVKLKQYLEVANDPLIIITWEELFDLIDRKKHRKIYEYFTGYMTRTKEDFRS